MTIVLLVLAVLDLAGFGYLALRLQRLDARERALRADLAGLDPVGVLPAPAERAFDSGAQLIAVEILNPLEVARARNKFARVAGAVAPVAIRGIVYEQAAKVIREQLVEQGVQADVEVLRAAG